MGKKIKFFSVIFIICIIILVSFWLIKNSSHPAQSASTDNVSGYAWSETIGWISFNCTNGDVCASSNYGVNIDSTTGNFSGYAWSENIGWIDFAPSGPFPVAPNYPAKLDFSTNKATGWAKAEANGDGWDGWILLGKEAGGWSNQVVIDTGTKELSGWAWGSDVIGWVGFNCENEGICGTSNYKVVADINFPPTVECSNTATWVFCVDSRNPTITWTYSDPDGDAQESYQLQIDNNSDFSSPEIDTGEAFSSGTAYHPSGSILNWSTTYYWRVKAKDEQGNWSDWCSPNCSFTTIGHAYPDVDFSWSPLNPSTKEPVQFTDETDFYNGANSWNWTFESAVPASSVLQNPITTFSEPGNWQVKLKATDSDGYMCPITKTINVNYPLPTWKEVIPN